MKYFIHKSSYLDENVIIGNNTKIWHFCHVQTGAIIGENCTLGQNVNIGNNVHIGNHVKIQNNVSVYEGVILEDNVFCGPSVVFTNDKNPRSKYPKKTSNYLKTIVKEGATLGANSTILCGITIGQHSLIGAGSVVTKNVGDYEIVVGNPAKRIGWLCECGEKLDANMTCISCGKTYCINKSGN
jgi:UDP-2-acetamido-3-amino-2,3-dideoxy-glucuronate N-acetyltransferase